MKVRWARAQPRLHGGVSIEHPIRAALFARAQEAPQAMMRSESRTRKALRLSLCVLILSSSITVPLLERGGFFLQDVVESEHDPATCAHPHDHRVCTQISANLSVAAGTHDHRLAHDFVDVAAPDAPRSTTAKPLLEGPPSRAPPLV